MKKYDYTSEIYKGTFVTLGGSKTKIKRILRKLVREAVELALSEEFEDDSYAPYKEDPTDVIAKRLVP